MGQADQFYGNLDWETGNWSPTVVKIYRQLPTVFRKDQKLTHLKSIDIRMSTFYLTAFEKILLDH